MSTLNLISHRLFVAALNQEKPRGINRESSPAHFAAEPAYGAPRSEVPLPSGLGAEGSQRSLLSKVVSARIPLLRA
jgi:hypothetical protein